LLLLVELKFLVVLVELKSLGGVGKTIDKIEISLQLLVELKSLNVTSKTIQSFCCC
jgi:hypothetical protein